MNAIVPVIKDWLPPALLRGVQNLMGKSIRFEGNYSSWEEASALCTGYNTELILEKVLNATLKVKHGEAAYERDSVLFDEIQYSWPVTAALMWAAARNAGELHVLDFGGALGSRYFENKKFIELLPKVIWSVVEQPHYVEQGNKHIANDSLRFYQSIDSIVEKNNINCILLSAILQYLSDPFSVIQKIKELKPDVIIIDRTIVNSTPIDHLHIQKVPSSIYMAAYPCRSLSEKKLLGHFALNYCLLSKFSSLSFPALDSINSEFIGYIFRSTQ